MPIIADEAVTYGYLAEDRHMVQSFIKNEMPKENWYDGLLVTGLMMASYKSAARGEKIDYNPSDLKGFKPKVAKGHWKP
jgi:hypothetical protein